MKTFIFLWFGNVIVTFPIFHTSCFSVLFLLFIIIILCVFHFFHIFLYIFLIEILFKIVFLLSILLFNSISFRNYIYVYRSYERCFLDENLKAVLPTLLQNHCHRTRAFSNILYKSMIYIINVWMHFIYSHLEFIYLQSF